MDTKPSRDQLVQAADTTLRELLRVLPLAQESGRLESWAKLYTMGYMLKLRAMR
jgi:hypothetical protein